MTQYTTAWHNLSIEETEHGLKTDTGRGLDSEAARAALERHGYNEFEQAEHRGLLRKFLDQFKSFMILVLLAAAVISGVVGQIEGHGFTDALIILAIVALNACIGVVQEAKAERSLDALKQMSAPHCRVVRDGEVVIIPARELVPGDVVVIETGDLVPADLRLTEAVNLKIQEAALTGESVPEDKTTAPLEGEVSLGDRENMAFSSCMVTYGRGRGIVVTTGMNTEVGKIAAMIQSVPETRTPLQIKIDQLGRFLGMAALGVCALVFVVGLLQGRDLLGMFMIAVSLAAAAIPEGLPAVSTIVLAVGVQRLARRNAIVRNLPSVEALGSTSVICSDKTGTLTQNKMTVVRLNADGPAVDISPDTSRELSSGQKCLLRAVILANDATLSPGGETTGDPTETALLAVGLRFGLNKNEMQDQSPREAEIPFDSDRKMMTTVHREADGLAVYAKGGLDEVLSVCTRWLRDGKVVPLTDEDRQTIRAANTDMAERALRVLAGASKSINALPDAITPETLEHDLTFVGMLGMIDPPRPEARDAVAVCRRAGIKPVMITGDHLLTATAIATELGIRGEGDTTVSGAELEKMSDEELRGTAAGASVYARVSPEHKVRIVRALQADGAIVAMTGDGVNDAPALKLADIGVAMGITGTDVSREAADVVLADDNFATIVTAVEEGRRIYDNILKAIQFMLSTNMGEILVIFTAISANWATPLLPIQILWINLVTDSLPALALSVDPADADVMNRKPLDASQSIMRGNFLLRILLQGAMIGGLSLIAFRIGLRTDVATAQTMTFAVLALSQIAHVFNVRSARHSALRAMFSNAPLLGALAVVLVLMLVVLHVPALRGVFHVVELNGTQWLWVVALSLAPLPMVEAVKAVIRVRRG